MHLKGKFITFEGIDGAGKSSHIEAVRELVQSLGHKVVCTREPGGTPLGEQVRQLFLAHQMSPHTEALLVFAARREHLEREVWPKLHEGVWVLCDRFTDATFAYQGGGRELGMEHISKLVEIVHPNFNADLTLLFDLPPDSAIERVASRGELDRIEREQSDFHDRVRSTYLARAVAEPKRIAVFDSRQTKEAVREQVLARVRALIEVTATR